MENNQKEKTIKITLGKQNILMVLVSIVIILTLINLYWTANLINQFTRLTGGVDNELKEAQLQQPLEQQEQQQPSKIEVSVDDDPSIGPKDAPITIVEFSDFRCPFCARAKSTTDQVLKTYGDKIRFVFRDFLILGPQSQKAAEAAECADEQGKFWEYHDMLFANQQALNDSNNLKKFAADLGLNTANFNNCLDSGKMAQEVEKDIRDGREYGVDGTPTFFINGISVVGAQPYSVFEQIIEQELAR